MHTCGNFMIYPLTCKVTWPTSDPRNWSPPLLLSRSPINFAVPAVCSLYEEMGWGSEDVTPDMGSLMHGTIENIEGLWKKLCHKQLWILIS